jgi:DNA-binding transcriptional ArsR family regulator
MILLLPAALVRRRKKFSHRKSQMSLAIGSAAAELSLLARRNGAALQLSMVAAANLVEVAALVGDTARATILAALMSGQALTGSELAYIARISRPTASEHLARLSDARLIASIKQGRFRYYRIASPLVATMLESIIAVAAIEVPARHQPRSAHDEALRFARTCYDHLAGRLGVAIAHALVAQGHVVLGQDGGEVTDDGRRFLAAFGADLTSSSKGKRIFCKPCLDWSERRYHLAGWVGAEICRCCANLRWIMRERDTRAVRVTSAGRAGLSGLFGIVSLDPTFAHPKSKPVSAVNAN